jgi:hypothetical protein
MNLAVRLVSGGGVGVAWATGVGLADAVGLGIVSGRLKTGQWRSIQNQPLDWLVTGVELCWQDAIWCCDGAGAREFCE